MVIEKKALLRIINTELAKISGHAPRFTNPQGDIGSMAQIEEANALEAFQCTSNNDQSYILSRCKEKIEDGTYGNCDYCGKEIPGSRLNANPFAIACVNCQKEIEAGQIDLYFPRIIQDTQDLGDPPRIDSDDDEFTEEAPLFEMQDR